MNEESSVDRMIREARENAHADVALSRDQMDFLGKAVEHVIPKIMDAVTDGLKRAMGIVEHRHIHGHGNVRSFSVAAWSRIEHAHATVAATLTGTGPEFTDIERAHYRLHLKLSCRPHPGAPPSSPRTVPVHLDAYGESRPGVLPEVLQEAVENEIALLLKIHL
jgi:hypothetical protein